MHLDKGEIKELAHYWVKLKLGRKGRVKPSGRLRKHIGGLSNKPGWSLPENYCEECREKVFRRVYRIEPDLDKKARVRHDDEWSQQAKRDEEKERDEARAIPVQQQSAGGKSDTPDGPMEQITAGFREAGQFIDKVIVESAALIAEPFVAGAALVEYAGSRLEGQSHKEATESAVFLHDDAIEATKKFSRKHAPKVRKAVGLVHGIEAGEHVVHGIGDMIASAPPIPDVPVQPFDPEDV
jgi:hypothetical protein